MYSLFVLKFVSVAFYDRIKLDKTLTHHTTGVSFYRTLFENSASSQINEVMLVPVYSRA